MLNYEWNRYGLVSNGEFSQSQIGALRVDIFNGMPGNLPGVHCSECLNKGLVAVALDNSDAQVHECHCVKMRNCFAQMAEAGLGDNAFRLNFLNFREETKWQMWVKRMAVRFANEPKGWLMIWGPEGSGKTHLGGAICYRRIYLGEEVRYSRWEDDVALLGALPRGSKSREHLLEALKTVSTLFWDDFFRFERSNGKRRIRMEEMDVTSEIIWYRHFNHLTTVLATDRNPADLFAIDEDIASTIMENVERNMIQLQKRISRIKA